jgi:glycosyltransferase involved in cell wall biosynthesis
MNDHRNQYFVDVAPVTKEHAVYAYLGLIRKDSRSFHDFARAVRKAVSCNSSHILLAPNFFQWPHWSSALAMVAQCALRARILLDEDHALALSQEHKSAIAACRLEIVRLVHESDCHPGSAKMYLGELDADEYLLVVTRRFPLIPVLHQLPLHKVRFYFPILHEFDSDLLLPPEVHQLIHRLRTSFPSLEVRPSGGLDVFDRRIPIDFELEPTLATTFEHNRHRGRPDISIIIPAYNNCGKLISVIRHLSRQTVGPERYEILVVDDGSDDGSGKALQEWLDIHSPSIALNYFYFSRSHPRCMGDDKFRAGIARNIGAKNARGEFLFFLDSDILLGPTYLDELLRLHSQYDVVQGRRVELRPEIISNSLDYEQVRLGTDTYYEGGKGAYWDSFYSSTQAWNDMPAGWRYCCTHSLSIRKTMFMRAKPFRRTFIHYGFEDTDMGFRLWSAGAKMILHGQHVLHLHDTARYSEYSGSHRLKLLLLAETAPSFYYNTLDDDVFNKLNYLFRWFHDSRYFFYPVRRVISRWRASDDHRLRLVPVQQTANMGSSKRSRRLKHVWSYAIYFYKAYLLAKLPAKLIVGLIRSRQ